MASPTLFDAILACIEGPCTDACQKADPPGIVNNEAWAGLIAEAIKTWAEGAVADDVLQRCIADRIWPLHTMPGVKR